MSELLVMIEGQHLGRVRMEQGGRLALDYEAGWRESAEGHSLSVSMPLAQIVYPQKLVRPYLWNLLPENPNVLQRWAQQYHVSAASPFKLLGHVGADVPGAAQFIPPDRLKEIEGGQRQTVEWMSLDELAERLRELRADVTAVRRPGDIGKMSLPGRRQKRRSTTGAADWRKLARECALEEERVVAMIEDMARALPDHISAAREQAVAEGLARNIVVPLAKQFVSHASERLAAIRLNARKAPSSRRR